MRSTLYALLASTAVWRARDTVRSPTRPYIDSGLPRLNGCLADGGWPLGELIELLQPAAGVGELQLLLPALRALVNPSHTAPRWLAWIAPPYIPYAPALVQGGLPLERVLWVTAQTLSDRMWAMEEALRSGSCVAVLAWLDSVELRWLRRLQLAAAHSHSLVVVFRSLLCKEQPSPASLRIVLEPTSDGLDLLIFKRRGCGPVRVCAVLQG